MPDESFGFEWRLFDQVSGPARKIEESLLRIEKSFNMLNTSAAKSRVSLQSIEQTIGGTGRAARSSTESWAMFGLKMGAVSGIANALTSTLLGLGRRAIGLAESGAQYAIEAASFHENTQIALEAVLGSKDAARAAMDQWQTFAAHTPFKTRDIVAWGEAYRIAGISAGDTMTLLKGTTDVAALNQGDPQAAGSFVDSILMLNARGRLDERELMRFAHLRIPENRIVHNLGRILGISDQQARELEKRGKITGQMAIQAVMQTVVDMGGGLGGLTQKASQSLSGLWSTVLSRPFELFEHLDESKGYKALKGVLRNLAQILDPHTASGKRIEAQIRSIGDSLGDWLKPLTGKDGKKNMEAFFTSVIAGAKEAFGYVAELASLTFTIGRFGVNVGKWSAATVSAFSDLISDDSSPAAKHDAAKFLLQGVLNEDTTELDAANQNSLSPEAKRRVAFQRARAAILSNDSLDAQAKLAMLADLRAQQPTVTFGDIHVTVHGDVHDPDKLGKKVADHVATHLVTHLEKNNRMAGHK